MKQFFQHADIVHRRIEVMKISWHVMLHLRGPAMLR